MPQRATAHVCRGISRMEGSRRSYAGVFALVIDRFFWLVTSRIVVGLSSDCSRCVCQTCAVWQVCLRCC